MQQYSLKKAHLSSLLVNKNGQISEIKKMLITSGGGFPPSLTRGSAVRPPL